MHTLHPRSAWDLAAASRGSSAISMDHMPEASSSTAPPPVVHQATFVFDSGLSRERYTKLLEQNGIVHKIVQRLMQKSGNNEQSVGRVVPSSR